MTSSGCDPHVVLVLNDFIIVKIPWWVSVHVLLQSIEIAYIPTINAPTNAA